MTTNTPNQVHAAREAVAALAPHFPNSTVMDGTDAPYLALDDRNVYPALPDDTDDPAFLGRWIVEDGKDACRVYAEPGIDWTTDPAVVAAWVTGLTSEAMHGQPEPDDEPAALPLPLMGVAAAIDAIAEREDI